MMRFLWWGFFLSLFFIVQAHAQVDDGGRQLTAEYGLSYHAVEGTDTNNNSSANLNSILGPYFKGSWTHRLGETFAYRLSGRTQLVEFQDIDGDYELKKREIVTNSIELAFLQMQNPYRQMGIFIRHQEHILYRAVDNDELELFKRSFAEPGVSFSWGNRRRIGAQIGVALQAFALLPTQGEDVVTGLGYGSGVSARLGWVTEAGVVMMIKGFYDYGTSPNATVNFIHEEFGYAFQAAYGF